MFINHADAQFFTVEFGAGPRTLVALGGWAGSWELWTLPFATLSRTWRTVGYDHRGTGATMAPAASITFERLVDDVFVILDALGIKTCVLAGESAGAAVAVQAAAQRPDRIAGLVLVDGMFQRPAPAAPDPFVQGLHADFAATVAWFADQCVPENGPDSAAIRRWGRQILARAGVDAAVQLAECMYGVDVRPLASRITQPALLIHGTDDRIAPLAGSEWMAAHIARSELHIIEGAGHVPTMTHAETVAALIDAFFGAEGAA